MKKNEEIMKNVVMKQLVDKLIDRFDQLILLLAKFQNVNLHACSHIWLLWKGDKVFCSKCLRTRWIREKNE